MQQNPAPVTTVLLKHSAENSFWLVDPCTNGFRYPLTSVRTNDLRTRQPQKLTTYLTDWAKMEENLVANWSASLCSLPYRRLPRSGSSDYFAAAHDHRYGVQQMLCHAHACCRLLIKRALHFDAPFAAMMQARPRRGVAPVRWWVKAGRSSSGGVFTIITTTTGSSVCFGPLFDRATAYHGFTLAQRKFAFS